MTILIAGGLCLLTAAVIDTIKPHLTHQIKKATGSGNSKRVRRDYKYVHLWSDGSECKQEEITPRRDKPNNIKGYDILNYELTASPFKVFDCSAAGCYGMHY